MKKLFFTLSIAGLVSATAIGGAVTNQAKWNVPWGDAFRVAVQETLADYETQINSDSATPSVQSVTLTGGSTIAGTSTSTTSRAAINIQPLASTTRAGVSRESLVTIGDITGTTPFGFGVTNHSTYGLMACFGRTAIASSDWDGNYDTALDARCINKFTNNAAYNLRGGYVKVKNYSGGVVGQMDGLTVEAVADGTEAEVAVLKLGSDASSVEYGIDMREIGTAATADIVLSEGGLIRNTDANTITITEAAVDVVGAFTANSISADNGWTGIITNASTLITNKITVVGGVITTNITTLP